MILDQVLVYLTIAVYSRPSVFSINLIFPKHPKNSIHHPVLTINKLWIVSKTTENRCLQQRRLYSSYTLHELKKRAGCFYTTNKRRFRLSIHSFQLITKPYLSITLSKIFRYLQEKVLSYLFVTEENTKMFTRFSSIINGKSLGLLGVTGAGAFAASR